MLVRGAREVSKEPKSVAFFVLKLSPLNFNDYFMMTYLSRVLYMPFVLICCVGVGGGCLT